jgi:2-desacetyl-2-hydroxyethyl bacteriochlorophyllide A dehydrogenase
MSLLSCIERIEVRLEKGVFYIGPIYKAILWNKVTVLSQWKIDIRPKTTIFSTSISASIGHHLFRADMNLTLSCTKPGEFTYLEAPDLHPGPGQVLLNIRRVGVCGTDLHAFDGTQPYFQYPRILGHELAADLVDGDFSISFEEGQKLTILPYFDCGKCQACMTGRNNCCVNLKVFGVHIDGGMRQQVMVPSHALVAGNGLSYDELALVEPLAIGVHAVRRAQLREEDQVLVIGAGPIGLGVATFAQMVGCHVSVIDINPARLEFTSNNAFADWAFNASDADLLERIRSLSAGRLPTVVFDATGNLDAIQNGFQYLAHGGRYVLVGLQKEPISFSHPEFHKREATLMSSRNALRRDFELVINSIQQKAIDPLVMITHRSSLADAAKQFPQWAKPQELVVKAMIEV